MVGTNLTTSIDERGTGLIGGSAYIDEASDAYSNLVEKIVKAAEMEATLKTAPRRDRGHQASSQRAGVRRNPSDGGGTELHPAPPRGDGTRGDVPPEALQEQVKRRTPFAVRTCEGSKPTSPAQFPGGVNLTEAETHLLDTETWGEHELLEVICSRYFSSEVRVLPNTHGKGNGRDGRSPSACLRF
ncbi:MAG: hypothetical protein Ct9H300mP30_3440 [Methanobacteriota archaeon]|nr:MAG: hypothetical protein Ct9H300mP30_3440 [Euryarchaeota archaeon]